MDFIIMALLYLFSFDIFIILLVLPVAFLIDFKRKFLSGDFK